MRTFRPGRGHLVLHGISDKKIAEWVKVTDRTARRWKRGEEPPYAALQVIELMNNGSLEVVSEHWTNWRIRGEKLISPEGFEFTTGQILAIPFLKRIISSYQSEQRLPRQADWVSEQWVPAVKVVNE